MNTQLHDYPASKNYKHRIQAVNRKAAQRLVEKDYAPIKSALPIRTITLVSIVIIAVILAWVVL